MIDVVGQAEAIVERLKSTVEESEQQRYLTDEAVALLHESGATRIMTPERFGGYEMSPRALVQAERVIAHGSPAASWVLMVTGAHTFIAGRMPAEGQDDVFGSDPGMLIPGVPSPRGTCAMADGGYVLNGRWPYASGADHGDWVMVGARGIKNDAGDRAPALLVVIPKEKVFVDDTWFTLGMRGTGSKDVVLDNVFVPDRHAIDMVQGGAGTLPGVESHLYRLPIRATLSVMLMGTIVGMAERGLSMFVDQTKGRVDAYTGAQKVNNTLVQQRVAESSAEIRCAWMLTMESCDWLEAAIEGGEPMGVEDRTRVRWNSAYGSDLCRRAIDRLYTGAGAGAAHDGNVLQAVFRDMNTSTHHAMVDYDNNVELEGMRMLGVELPDAMV